MHQAAVHAHSLHIKLVGQERSMRSIVMPDYATCSRGRAHSAVSVSHCLMSPISRLRVSCVENLVTLRNVHQGAVVCRQTVNTAPLQEADGQLVGHFRRHPCPLAACLVQQSPATLLRRQPRSSPWRGTYSYKRSSRKRNARAE